MFSKKLFSECPNLKDIEQKYFAIGHSYNACDRNFAVIENHRKTAVVDLFIPDHWKQVISDAKKKDPKFIVTEMKQHNFFSSSVLEKLVVNRKVATDKTKINWLRFESIKHTRNDFFTMLTKG